MAEKQPGKTPKPIPETKSCFVISPIGQPGSDIRYRADMVLEYIIRPAVERQCNYVVTRADEISAPGLITAQIMDRITGDDLVVADLTGLNPNVFYELAVRHAVDKPVIQIMEQGEEPPFDVAGMRTIFVDHHDLKSANECMDNLVAAITAIEKGETQVVSPISFAIDLDQLRRSGNMSEEQNAVVLNQLHSEMSRQRRTLRKIENQLGSHGSSAIVDSALFNSISVPSAPLVTTSDLYTFADIFRGSKQCSMCGTGNPKDEDHCRKCGAELPVQDQ